MIFSGSTKFPHVLLTALGSNPITSLKDFELCRRLCFTCTHYTLHRPLYIHWSSSKTHPCKKGNFLGPLKGFFIRGWHSLMHCLSYRVRAGWNLLQPEALKSHFLSLFSQHSGHNSTNIIFVRMRDSWSVFPAALWFFLSAGCFSFKLDIHYHHHKNILTCLHSGYFSFHPVSNASSTVKLKIFKCKWILCH